MNFFPITPKKYCLNGRTSLNVNLDYANDFMDTYKLNGFFGLMFIADYSHASSGQLNQIDNDLLDFLKKFSQNEILKSSTILILFSDHGPRFAENRKTMKGLLEERNPFYSIYLPSLFKQRYPKESETFFKNSDKLITPMDIHRTLIDLIGLENKESHILDRFDSLNRSKSMFSDKISFKRTCGQANIDEHWCACLKRTKINVINSRLTMIAKKFVSYLNNILLKDHFDLCSKLEFIKINHVFQLETVIPKKKEFKHENFSLIKWFESLINRIFNFYLVEPTVEKDFKKYFFQIVTAPNNAIYEFTVVDETYINGVNKEEIIAEDVKSNLFEIDHKAISRIDRYGDQSKCIHDQYPDLRKYCFCKFF
jgi:hypothetical protein